MMEGQRPYREQVNRVEDLFTLYGDSHKGLGYPKADGFEDRYRVYYDVVRFAPEAPETIRLLDVGCGTARLLDHIEVRDPNRVIYRGIDMSAKIVAAAREKHPTADFVIGDPFELKGIWTPSPDFVVMGGIFTWRPTMSEAEMTSYMLKLLGLAFSHTRIGIAFNVMSKHVDWERDDLFHVPFDTMAALLRANLTGNYVFRSDYGLYEYTTYIYR